MNRLDPSGRADSIETIFTVTVIATPTEVALSALAGQALEAIALLQAGAGQVFLTTQYMLELTAAFVHASGIEKFLVCTAGGLMLSQYLDEKHISGWDKVLVMGDFSAACGIFYPAPGWPGGPNQQ